MKVELSAYYELPVCAMREEKNGAHLSWKTYLRSKNKKNFVIRFRHNRFNMIFMVSGAVFYHAEDLKYFIDHVHGTNKLYSWYKQ